VKVSAEETTACVFTGVGGGGYFSWPRGILAKWDIAGSVPTCTRKRATGFVFSRHVARPHTMHVLAVGVHHSGQLEHEHRPDAGLLDGV
jgi:hypothetical protein